MAGYLFESREADKIVGVQGTSLYLGGNFEN